MKFFFTLLLLFSSIALGQNWENDPASHLYAQIFTQEKVPYKAIFHESFLKAVPEKKLEEIVMLYRLNLGEYVSCIKKEAGKYELIFKEGKAPSSIVLNAQNQITGLWFGHWVLYDDTYEKIIKEFKNIRGKVSVTLLKNKKELLSINSDVPMAVGSAFKLFVLKALEEKKKQGGCKDETILTLSAKEASLPSGMIQEWPDKTPMTLASLAHLMISISDNTATDTLMRFLGREYVERFVPDSTKPLLMTREMFILKWGLSAEYMAEYPKADLEHKRKILEKLAEFSCKDVVLKLEKPVCIDTIEWFISTKQLCEVIHELKDHPALGINPGLVDKTKWQKVGYKGGSEPGVLNYTLVLQKLASNDIYLLSATVNDTQKDVNTNQFTELVLRLINLISEDNKQ